MKPGKSQESPSTIGSPPIDVREYLDFVRALEKRGIKPAMAEAIKDFIDRRERAKKEGKKMAELGYKLLQVSAYGAVGTSEEGQYRSRFPNPDFYNTVTALGRHILMLLAEEVKGIGMIPLYGDSDSIFATGGGLSSLQLALRAHEIANTLNQRIKERLMESFGLDQEHYSIELEAKAVYEFILFPSKAMKRYRGDVVWEGDFTRRVEVAGFEMKRADAFPLLKEVQDELQRYLVEVPPEKFRQQVLSYLDKVKRELFSGARDADLILSATVRKGDLGEYEHENIPHIRVAKKMMEMGYVDIGGSIQWIVVSCDKGGRVEEPVLPDRPLPKPTPSGYEYYYRRILQMCSRLLGWRREDFEGAQTKLFG